MNIKGHNIQRLEENSLKGQDLPMKELQLKDMLKLDSTVKNKFFEFIIERGFRGVLRDYNVRRLEHYKVHSHEGVPEFLYLKLIQASWNTEVSSKDRI